MDAMQELAKQLQGLDPEQNDFRKTEGEIRRLKAEYEATREQHQADLAHREAELLATIYKDIQSMTSRVAQFQKIQFVVKVTNGVPSGSDPNTVMAAMSHSIVYHDPSLDITNHVVYYLNEEYKKQGGKMPPPDATLDPATTPTGATAPVPATPRAAPTAGTNALAPATPRQAAGASPATPR
jgi:outer membrane protein